MTLTSEAGSMHDLAWYADVPRSIRKHAIIGLTLTIGCFGAFGVWGATAPLAAAVIT
jgi:membrane fusion protein, type I secretion system